MSADPFDPDSLRLPDNWQQLERERVAADLLERRRIFHDPVLAKSAGVVVFPCLVVVDTREQRPFSFTGLSGDARNDYRPLLVALRRGCLEQGDYSLEGFEGRIAVERKSLVDLYGTFGRGRDRFERELQRLNALAFAAVVVEADWPEVLRELPDRSQLNPLSVFRSVVAWQQRFPRVHWWMCPGRVFAERVTFRILQRFYLDQTPRKKVRGGPLGCTPDATQGNPDHASHQ